MWFEVPIKTYMPPTYFGLLTTVVEKNELCIKQQFHMPTSSRKDLLFSGDMQSIPAVVHDAIKRKSLRIMYVKNERFTPMNADSHILWKFGRGCVLSPSKQYPWGPWICTLFVWLRADPYVYQQQKYYCVLMMRRSHMAHTYCGINKTSWDGQLMYKVTEGTTTRINTLLPPFKSQVFVIHAHL